MGANLFTNDINEGGVAKKIFSIPDVTAKFIQEVLDLPIRSVEILEGNQIHEQGFLGDYPFELL